MNDDTTGKKNIGQIMIDHLVAKGRATRQAGRATTEELAAAAGVSLKDAYCRLWWLASKEGRLVKSGRGKAAVWRTAPKARKAAPKPAVEAPPSEDSSGGVEPPSSSDEIAAAE